MSLATIYQLLLTAGTSASHFPPTLLYNEGWMLRLTLSWFQKSTLQGHTLSFAEGANWFSEALLPTPFAPRHRGTHACRVQNSRGRTSRALSRGIRREGGRLSKGGSLTIRGCRGKDLRPSVGRDEECPRVWAGAEKCRVHGGDAVPSTAASARDVHRLVHRARPGFRDPAAKVPVPA